ncbi:PilZ domain-containing protein [Pseudobacteroides cellulosolvens]|uniref:Type IV pilus assembly PilZ n=1 Tax=Pseudobacteroides cellulosolvens ATCC 35603 = DSM 2933 TaxID=398512 RepID=A0A0L6JLT5_9FIRM|nr:PilZ domain-containing protein [Pseudobacteroides cellulosolvens]KNY26719.1 type IV pilus assembly PilZ [Pseudobacteroides cellulosolvens ATCC 35603 = DSM 2933]
MTAETLEKAQILNEIKELYDKTGGMSVDKTKIINIMQKGSFIKTQFYGSNKWNVNLVLDNTNNMLKVAFIEDDGIPALLPGDNIRCRFAVDTYDVNMLCTIDRMKCDFLPTKSLRILKADIWKNKRASSRHNAGFLCRGESELNEKFSGYFINLSESGTGLICRENLRVGSSVKISIFVSESKRIDFYSYIVRSKRHHDQKFEYGTRFSNMTPQLCEIIDNFINNEKNKEIITYQDLCKKYNITPLDFI